MEKGWTEPQKNDKALGTPGDITQPAPGSPSRSPKHAENYDATDGRHNRADHQGWESVDPRSGPVSDTDFGDSTGRFEDGPGPWRQT